MKTTTFRHDRMQTLRQSQGYTITALANKLGITRQHVSMWEHQHYEPSLALLVKLAYALDVSTDYLLGITDNPERIMNNW